MNQATNLILSCSALVLLTFGVGIRMFIVRIKEMKKNKITPQSVASSMQRAKRLQDSRASDNYNHLFELPVLFYALCALAIASQQIPVWLPITAWVFVVLRVVHSIIQCTYNQVMHRFSVFMAGFVLLGIMWVAFLISYLINVSS